MANWSVLKAAIASIIKANNNQEITGPLLQNVLNSIVSSVGENRSFAGIAVPVTNPGAPDGQVFYIAGISGSYPNFGVEYIDTNNSINILIYKDDKWLVEKVYITATNIFYSLPITGKKINSIAPSNTISDYIINADGSDRALPGYSIKEYAVKKGESYIIDIQNDFNDIFAIFTVCDTSGNAYYIQRGNPYFIKGEDKRNTINIAEDGLLRVSFTADGQTKIYDSLDVLYNENNIFSILPIKGGKSFGEIEPVSITENSILNTEGAIISSDNYIVKKYAVKKNDIYVVSINDALNGNYFSIFALYNENGEAYYIQKGNPYFIKDEDRRNILTIPYEGFIQISSKPVSLKNEIYLCMDFSSATQNNVFYTTYNLNLTNKIEVAPSNIISDYIITSTNENMALSGYSIKEYAVKKGESYIIDIQNDFMESFAIFTVCDTSGNAYYIQRGNPYFIKGEDKRNTINIAEDGLLRVSFSTDGQTKVYNYIEATRTTYTFKDVLWIGTSIPAGGSYPRDAANELGFNVYNKSIGSSGIVLNYGILNNGRDCLDLSETTLEKRIRYGEHIGENEYITAERIENSSFDSILLPYINGDKASCKLIMFDHGYNDRSKISTEVALGEDSINWNSTDRTTYVGAFNYLLQKIYAIDPTIIVCVVGYFSNNHIVDGVNCKDVCTMQTWLSKHYNLPLLDVWNILNIADYTLPGTSIDLFKQFCPDGVHPFSDTTGNSNKLYSCAIIKLMRDFPG